MASRVRIFILSVCGFLIPILLAFFLAPYLFDDSIDSGGQYQRARMEEAEQEASPVEELPGGIDPAGNFVTVASAPELDPTEGKTFVVSFLMRFKSFPKVGKRSKIIFKYAATSIPYPGWAIAWRRLRTSLRPEVYWQDESGAGGWFTFEDVEVRLDTWYEVTLFAEPNAYLSLYLDTPPSLEDVPFVHASAETSGDAAEPFVVPTPSPLRVSAVHYAGGFDLQELGVPKTDDMLHVLSGEAKNEGFAVDVAQVVLGSASKPPGSLAATKSFLAGGFASVVNYLGKDEGLSLWLDSSGTDRSRFGRTLGGT